MTMSREEVVKHLMEKRGMTLREAEYMVAIAEGEIGGDDVEMLDEKSTPPSEGSAQGTP